MAFLDSTQKNIIDKCSTRTWGGLSIPMFGGTTRIGVVLADMATEKGISLIVCNKYIICFWIDQIRKYGYQSKNYTILHPTILKI